MPGDPFYSLPEWRALRAKALARAHWKCEFCDQPVHEPGASRVDHIKTRKHHPDLALVLGNLRVLCASCDNRRHAGKGQPDAALRGADANGMPTSPLHHWNRGTP